MFSDFQCNKEWGELDGVLTDAQRWCSTSAEAEVWRCTGVLGCGMWLGGNINLNSIIFFAYQLFGWEVSEGFIHKNDLPLEKNYGKCPKALIDDDICILLSIAVSVRQWQALWRLLTWFVTVMISYVKVFWVKFHLPLYPSSCHLARNDEMAKINQNGADGNVDCGRTAGGIEERIPLRDLSWATLGGKVEEL